MSKQFLENLKEGKCKGENCDKLSLMDSDFCKEHSEEDSE